MKQKNIESYKLVTNHFCSLSSSYKQRACDNTVYGWEELSRDARNQRTSLKNVRISSTSSSGCSRAAKCPPRGMTVQWTMLKRFSAHRLGGALISFGKIAAPVGVLTYPRGCVGVAFRLS